MTTLMLPQESAHLPMYKRIFDYMKSEIRNGHWKAGSTLPSIRKCALELHVNKNTVDAAYQLLLSEGYIYSVAKKGYIVASIVETVLSDSDKPLSASSVTAQEIIDFKYGNIELRHFPISVWNRLRNRLFKQFSEQYEVVGDPYGEAALRSEIIKLVHSGRGIHVREDQVIIGSTPQQLVTVLAQLLDKEQIRLGVENPGYDGARLVFHNMGYDVTGIPLLEDGIDLVHVERSGVNALYVSSSQQFTSKLVLPLHKRMQLAEWASAHEDRWLIEDDYEWEYRYSETPLPSICSMGSSHHIIYIGSLSKSIIPLCHISYMIVPDSVIELMDNRLSEYDQPVSRLDQLTLAAFLAEGCWHKHVARLRKYYERKMNHLQQAILTYMGDSVSIQGKDMGMHVFLEVHLDCTEEELLAQAHAAGVRVYGTSRYWTDTTKRWPVVLLGVGSLDEEQMVAGVKLLAYSWFSSH
ncbi:PLP-dependent aminotransferase family protein [Paenibacillus sp. ACRRX]|uniref:MocR-like pyridoxine biosynthesis transcription factor PdxR n=1 Tax=unclassified Paenibacillus TaxID=185978 RepID=UPI001EF65E7E|nr:MULTISPECIES: PLP-dependent aminotransferase family protein [unclassified Paenibacillus]MCG7410051.1 PLP-dependent aminotransferase family protein [Paenibacillus sp. ACRRX]MDK8183625.1 PLP-dependent aminotransferase family protein [Paenibacillus sp. UMB4589-SE434]